MSNHHPTGTASRSWPWILLGSLLALGTTTTLLLRQFWPTQEVAFLVAGSCSVWLLAGLITISAGRLSAAIRKDRARLVTLRLLQYCPLLLMCWVASLNSALLAHQLLVGALLGYLLLAPGLQLLRYRPLDLREVSLGRLTGGELPGPVVPRLVCSLLLLGLPAIWPAPGLSIMSSWLIPFALLGLGAIALVPVPRGNLVHPGRTAPWQPQLRTIGTVLLAGLLLLLLAPPLTRTAQAGVWPATGLLLGCGLAGWSGLWPAPAEQDQPGPGWQALEGAADFLWLGLPWAFFGASLLCHGRCTPELLAFSHGESTGLLVASGGLLTLSGSRVAQDWRTGLILLMLLGVLLVLLLGVTTSPVLVHGTP